MKEPKDYPLGDTSKDYCVNCATPDGALKSYEEALDGMTAFMVQTQGLDQAAAREAVRSMLATMPAWRDRGKG
jgi:hypothetical protein